MADPKVWTIEVTFSEDDERTQAEALLLLETREVRARGTLAGTRPTRRYRGLARRSRPPERSPSSPTSSSTMRPTGLRGGSITRPVTRNGAGS